MVCSIFLVFTLPSTERRRAIGDGVSAAWSWLRDFPRCLVQRAGPAGSGPCREKGHAETLCVPTAGPGGGAAFTADGGPVLADPGPSPGVTVRGAQGRPYTPETCFVNKGSQQPRGNLGRPHPPHQQCDCRCPPPLPGCRQLAGPRGGVHTGPPGGVHMGPPARMRGAQAMVSRRTVGTRQVELGV